MLAITATTDFNALFLSIFTGKEYLLEHVTEEDLQSLLLLAEKRENKKHLADVISKLEYFGDLARSKNFPLYYDTPTGTDPNIKDWIPNATVSSDPIPKGKWTQVDTKKGTTEEAMRVTAQKMHLSQAIDKHIEELENGTFDELATCRTIFLEENNTVGNALGLVCLRYSDGKLHLYVYEVNPGFVCCAAGYKWFEQ